MTASDTQRKRTRSTQEGESPPERVYRPSRPFRNVYSFVGGMTLGLLPLVLFLLNHLTLAPPYFPFNPSLTFCDLQTHLPEAKSAALDTAAFILYPIVACLGVPAMLGIGMAFHWRRSTRALGVSGLLLAAVLEFYCYFAFLWPLAFRQCFHLVGWR